MTKKELLHEGEKLGEIEHWLLLGDFTKFLSPIVNFFIINYYPTNKKRKKKLVPMAFFNLYIIFDLLSLISFCTTTVDMDIKLNIIIRSQKFLKKTKQFS